MFIDFNAKRLPFFVYGSLLTGLHNWEAYIKPFQHTVVEGAVSNADMFAYKDHFPYVTAGVGQVHGEVVQVAAEDFYILLALLDGLEGYSGPNAANNHYIRNEVTVQTADGPVEAYMYFAAPETAITVREVYPPVASGSWRQWRQDWDRRQVAV